MPSSITRREWLGRGAVIAAEVLAYQSCLAQPVEARPATHIYKTVNNLPIKADVYRFPDKRIRPVVVWKHGGALIGGHRGEVPGRIKRYAMDAGYVLISIDYRLAPETLLPQIIEDIEDAFRWIRREGAQQFYIDPKRIAVIGGSAGGYLTLTTGFRVDPHPTVLFCLWGYGDLIGDWYSKPSPHQRHHQSKLSREEAYRQVSGPPISDARDRDGDGGAFYQYCRRTGTWPIAVAGADPIKSPQRFHPYMPAKKVTADYPPTVLLHGTADTDVPFEQSVMMTEQLKRHKVPHLLLSIQGGEHGLSGGDPQQIEEAYANEFAFVDESLMRR
jgi:acetyl esterase/lipase